MDGYLWARCIDKYATSIAAEIDIDPRIMAHPEFANICAHEIIRFMCGMPYNFYPIGRVPWHMADSEDVRLECMFYSALAQLAMGQPSIMDDYDAFKFKEAAAAWNPDMVLTREMLLGKVAAVEGGVKLRSHDQAVDFEDPEVLNGTAEAPTTLDDVTGDDDDETDIPTSSVATPSSSGVQTPAKKRKVRYGPEPPSSQELWRKKQDARKL